MGQCLRMRRAAYVAGILSASAIALGAATAAGYVLSVLQEGGWKYTELIAPICGLVMIVALAAGIAGYITGRNRGVRAIVRMAGLLTLGYCAAAAGLYFAALSNCRLSCGNKVLTEARSPDGRWKAVTFSRNCVAVTRYCPPLLNVSVLQVSQKLPEGEGNVFTIDFAGGVAVLKWKSDNLLVVGYSMAPVLRQKERVGDIHVEYQLAWHM
ncbi:MAG TPA: hypothetical protein VJN43_20210 [Bryobacteraceae bacterium]|nr:hypothetical protein [Bryobacteraceae bacterium]